MFKLLGVLLFSCLIFTVLSIKVEVEPQGAEIIKNGDFEKGNADWISSDMEAYSNGSAYNSRWKSKIVTELDAKKNTVITQKFTIWNGQVCVLKFDAAPREKWPLDSSGFSVFYNDIFLAKVLATDYELKSFTYYITLWSGENTVSFKGEGKDDGLGTTIDNVSVKCPNSI